MRKVWDTAREQTVLYSMAVRNYKVICRGSFDSQKLKKTLIILLVVESEIAYTRSMEMSEEPHPARVVR